MAKAIQTNDIEEGTACHYHSDRPATQRCRACNKAMCLECLTSLRQYIICIHCNPNRVPKMIEEFLFGQIAIAENNALMLKNDLDMYKDLYYESQGKKT